MDTSTLDKILDIQTDTLEAQSALIPATDMTPTVIEAEAVTPATIVKPVEEKQLEDDFQFARTGIRDMVTEMRNVLAAAQLLAQSGDSPRAYEVVGKLLENIVNANKELLELHRTKKDTLEDKNTPQSLLPHDSGGNVTVNAEQAVFVGRASDLLRELNKAKKQLASGETNVSES